MKILSLALVVLFAACQKSEITTTYTQYMSKRQAENQWTPKDDDQGMMTYYEGTIVPLGKSTLDGEISILQRFTNGGDPDGLTGATRLFRGMEPKKGRGITFSKDAAEVYFLGAMTNNLEDANLKLPELTMKIFVRDNGTIEYGEWEYLRIGCRNLNYYGTYRVTITNGKWDPNASTVSRPGDSDAVGTAEWNSETKEITLVTVVTDTEGQRREIRSVFGFDQIYRQYDMIAKWDYDGNKHTSYHLFNKQKPEN